MNPLLGKNGAVVAPHSLAAQAGLDILREGGNAVEASIAVASTLAVVYPHMTGIGGDGFWLIHSPGEVVQAIDACGAAGSGVTRDIYTPMASIPWRGPLAANTVAGTLSGWGKAYQYSLERMGGRIPFSRLLESAIGYAKNGFPVTQSQVNNTRAKGQELSSLIGFAQSFLSSSRQAPEYGSIHSFPRLAKTLEQLAREGTEDFYRGDLSLQVAKDLEQVGSPLQRIDLQNHQAVMKPPLELQLQCARLFNTAPPTQGLASMLILGIYEKIRQPHWSADNAQGIHGLVEATKQAFKIRDQYVTDPSSMKIDLKDLMSDVAIEDGARSINLHQASPWPAPVSDGDTTWLGVIDNKGRAVSMIQSIYFEFGSGVVLPETGIWWQNRGCSFDLRPHRLRSLAPGLKPFHTLNPAMAKLADGRLLVYGTMGGEGQPQTQAAVFSRYAWDGHHPRSAVAAPRWLLGKTWAEQSTTLKLESRFNDEVVQGLKAMGHPIEMVSDYDERLGHAGALVLHPSGLIEGGEDPRSDGCVASW
jgi:gamma-glutamyltranspeptidase